MFSKIKAVLRALLIYVAQNPGATTVILGWAVLAFAKLGLHVTEGQLAALFAAIVPILTGVHVGARRARRTTAVHAAAQSTSNQGVAQ